MADEAFDVIVVGAGSAGCALAAGLSEDPRCRVLLVEAGGRGLQPWIHVPIGYAKSYHDPAINWRFETQPEPALLGRTGYWPRGKVLGGSSAINAMVYCRGVPGDYDDWRDAGNPGWGWDDLYPVFRSFERHVGPDGREEGDGPLFVSDREPEYHPLKRHFYAAAAELGIPVGDLNGPDPHGVGPYPITTRRGLRCSSADAFLRPAMKRPNLAVFTRTQVDRVLFEGRRAVGIACRRGGTSLVLRARGDIVLCAGAVATPLLMQRSGIGPGPLLASLGIEVLHASEAVGGNLQDHLGITYFYRATEPTLNDELGRWPGLIRAGWAYATRRGGPLSLSVNQIGGMVRSSPDLPRPDIQLYFNPLSYSATGEVRRRMTRPDTFPGFITGFNSCRPTSRGRIDIASPDPAAPPRIAPNYLSTGRDVADVVAGARLIARFEATRAMRCLVDGKPRFDIAGASDEALLHDFRERAGSVYHPCGTCRMAPQDAGGVVGPDLRVHGVEGLRIADASVFPNITSANTNAPSILVGVKAAAIMRAAWRG